MSEAIKKPKPTIHSARVVAQVALCRDHFRLTVICIDFADAKPGQFVHLSPELTPRASYLVFEAGDGQRPQGEIWEVDEPMLRRAFSIAGLRAARSGVELDVIYRVVGKGTRWLSTLAEGDELSLLGPLGNAFPIHPRKQHAWLVAGGVGLPPMLWLSQALHGQDKNAVAFCGAQSADLLALSLDRDVPPDSSARSARPSAREFAVHGVGVILSTDDGTLGFKGHVGQALSAYADANPPEADDLVMYTCGPERMMRFVAEFCETRGIECHVCMERNMACSTGMCQSCVVPIRDAGQRSGWRYRLCCTEGPIFRACDVLWDAA